MNATVRAVIAAVMLPGAAFGQPSSNQPIRTVRISGRTVDANHSPIAGATLKCRNTTRQQDVTIILDQDGKLAYSAVSHDAYEIYIVESRVPPTFTEIGEIVAVDGPDLDLGDIVMQVLPRHQVATKLVGPVKVGQSSPARPTPSSTRSRGQSAPKTPHSIAAIFIGAAGTPNIIDASGKVFQPPKEKDQVDIASPQISEDRREAGWLADFPFCCTSYPISLALVLYRPGKPLRRFKGDGRSIFDWKFMEGGKQVAFYQDFLHGTQAQHYELRDVDTGRLIDKWDGDLTSKAPRWTKGMRS